MEGTDRPIPTPERKSERKPEKRQQILDGAVRVFAEKGFFTGTMAEISRAAAVAEGTIYLYFKSKDELLLSIFDESMKELGGRASKAIEGATTASDALRRVCVAQMEAVQGTPALAAVLIVELRQSNAFVRDVEKPALAGYLNLIGDSVQRGQASGEFRAGVHPAAVKRAIFGALDEIALSWLVAKRRFDLMATTREIADTFVRGLAA